MKKYFILTLLTVFFYMDAFCQAIKLCDIDKSKMIPLRDAKFRKYQFTVKLKGSAINQNTPYEILFDTGSWTTSIPGGALNLSKINILKENVNDPWGNFADLVSGQLILESTDGTPYELNDYTFYALKDRSTNKYMPDDRTAIYGSGSILGAFPSIDPYTKLPSVPYALTLKYAPNDMGLGIISNCYEDIDKNWGNLKSYLQVGNDPKINNLLNFRSDIPNWRNQQEFHPEAVPGFQIKINFPGTDKTIESLNTLIATVDTGAPDLTIRLGPNDPQDQTLLASHFVREGSWQYWNNQEYMTNAKTLINANVKIEFTDSQGILNYYNFPIGNNPYSTPNILFTGKWNSNVPYTLRLPDGPVNRINLGNTIYFYCPVYVWDIKNKRVGIGFKKQCELESKLNTSSVVNLCSGNSVNITGEAIGLYPPFTYKWKAGDVDISNQASNTISKPGIYIFEVTDNKGCKASTAVQVNQIALPNATIRRNGPTDLIAGGSIILSVQEEETQTYQWYKDGQALEGATNSSVTANSQGIYSVKVTKNGCSSMSEIVKVTMVLASSTTDKTDSFIVTPNPINDFLTVRILKLPAKGAKFTLYNLNGSAVKEWDTRSIDNRFNVSELAAGTYIFQYQSGNIFESIKVLKN